MNALIAILAGLVIYKVLEGLEKQLFLKRFYLASSFYLRRFISMENDYKLVDFDKYCKTCIHMIKDESQEPCNSCLEA